MTTIDGTTFNLISVPSFQTVKRAVRSRSPGSDTNPITHMGYDGLTIRIRGVEYSLATYDSVMTAFLDSGEKDLIITSGWKYKVHSTVKDSSKDVGIADGVRYPYGFTLLTETPYQYSSSTVTSSKTITTNNQEWSASDGAVDITTTGTVKAVPDIQVTNLLTEVLKISQSSRWS